MHALHASRLEQDRVIYLDFHLADEPSRTDLTSFLRFLSEAIAEQLDLDWDVVEGYWQAVRNPAQTFNRFLQREVLQRSDQKVLLASTPGLKSTSLPCCAPGTRAGRSTRSGAGSTWSW
jgi:hypothetical protein